MNRLRLILFVILILIPLGPVQSQGFSQDGPPPRAPEAITALIVGDPSTSFLPAPTRQTLPPSLSHAATGGNPPSWSRLAFETYRDGNWESYLIDPDETNEVRLTNHPALDIHPFLNRGATQVLFSSNRNDDYEIYEISSTGNNLIQRTSNSSEDVLPAWSPDGSKIAFQSNLPGNYDIYTMNADGSGLAQITTDGGLDGMPGWSPDGSQIVFASNRGATMDLWIMNADGSNQTPLNIGFYAYYPVWSPLGDKIAFAGDSNSDGFLEVWTVNVDGSDPVQVVPNGSETDAWFPAWSPDGEWLSFTYTYWFYFEGSYYWYASSLYAWGLNGGGLIEIAQDDEFIWRSTWASTDVTAPGLCTLTAPSPAKWASFPVSFSAQDVGGSGVRSYDVEARTEANPTWQPVVTGTTFSTALFNSGQSGSVDLRCRARDLSGNAAAWPEAPSASLIVEVSRPISQATTDTRYVQGLSATIEWEGYDVEGDVSSFDVYVRDSQGDWEIWQEDVTSTSAAFTGTSGQTVYFRSQATDAVGHTEPWEPTPDTAVTLYASQLSGVVTDARGNMLAQPFLQTDPPAAETFIDPVNGYLLYLSDTLTHTLVITAGGFAPLAPISVGTAGDATLDGVLTPETELVTNGGFETGLNGWAVTGAGVQTLAAAAHSGGGGAQFQQAVTGTQQITQTFVISSELHAPTLSFLYTVPADLGSGNFEVLVDGSTPLTVLSTDTATGGWTHTWADLSAFSGETITLTLQLEGVGTVEVDEISVGPWETPLLSSISPAAIPGWEAASLTLAGENFLGNPAVWVDGVPLTEVVASSSQITATLPAGLGAGLYDVQVTNPGGVVAILPAALTVEWHQIFLPLTANKVDVSASLGTGADWPTLGQNNAHTGVNANDPGASRYALAWTFTLPFFQAGGDTLGTLAVGDGILVAASSESYQDSGIIALDANTGGERWQYTFSGKFSINPASIAHGVVYFQENQIVFDTNLFALDLYAGTLLWKSSFGAQANTYLPPVVTNSSVFINGGSYGGIYGFDPGTGKENWFTELAQYDEWTPAYLNGRLFAFVNDSLLEIDTETGSPLWSTTVQPTSAYKMHTSAVLTSNTALLANNAGLYAIDLTTHEIKWSVPGDFYKTIPAVQDGWVYAIKEGQLRVYDLSSGEEVWSFDGDSALTHAPVVAGNYVYAASPSNTYVLDRDTHEAVWQTDHGGWLAVANGFLYIGQPDKVIYAFRAQEP